MKGAVASCEEPTGGKDGPMYCDGEESQDRWVNAWL